MVRYRLRRLTGNWKVSDWVQITDKISPDQVGDSGDQGRAFITGEEYNFTHTKARTGERLITMNVQSD